MRTTKGDTITVIILFAVIIGISLWISHASCMKKSMNSYTGYTPYSKNNIGGSNYIKEGFQAVQQDDVNEQNDAHNCVQLAGWKGEGVYCHPNGGLEKIDVYSDAKGDVSCKHSSGYHNSKGGLCLDDKMMKLLTTRGMNASGGYGQIGTGQA